MKSFKIDHLAYMQNTQLSKNIGEDWSLSHCQSVTVQYILLYLYLTHMHCTHTYPSLRVPLLIVSGLLSKLVVLLYLSLWRQSLKWIILCST